MNLNDFAVPNKLPQQAYIFNVVLHADEKFCTHRLKMANFNMLTMFFGKRNKFKVFILWRVRAELNFSFFLMILCTHETVFQQLF